MPPEVSGAPASTGPSNINPSTPAPKAPAANPKAEPMVGSGIPEEHASAAKRAADRKRSGTQAPASNSPAAGLSSGKTKIQETRSQSGKSFLEGLKEKSRKHNPDTKPVEREIQADDSAMPGKGPSEVASGEPEVRRPVREPEPAVEEEPARSREAVETDPAADFRPGVDPDAEVTEGEPEAEAQTYEPKLKYTAFGQEHEIPELFQGLIKDPESERQVHEVFEKSAAFERYKAQNQQLDTLLQTKVVPELQFHRQTREMFQGLLQKGDYLGVLSKMNVPAEKVLQAAADYVRIKQLPPEQRAQYEARAQAEAEREAAASQVQAMQSRMVQLESLAKQTQIQSTFARGDVKAVADGFDAKIGKVGAFESEVRQLGAFYWAQGKDIPPEQAVGEVMARFGLTFQSSGAQGAPAQAGQAQKVTVTAPVSQKAPATGTKTARIIPNIPSQASAATVTRPQVNNVEDLKKLRNQMRGR